MYGLDYDDVEVCEEHQVQYVVGEECEECENKE